MLELPRHRRSRAWRDRQAQNAARNSGDRRQEIRLTHYTYRSARSGSLVAGIVIALSAETLGIHLWVSRHSARTAWIVTAVSLYTLVWIVRDYVGMGKGAVVVDDVNITMNIGGRIRAVVARSLLAEANRPSWRDIPATGMSGGEDFLNLTKPASPNVMLILREPVSVRILGFSRHAGRIGLHLDEPDRFLAEVTSRV